MPSFVSSHPLIQHKLTILRNMKTSASDFRHVLKEITFYLGFEATRDLTLTTEQVATPAEPHFMGQRIGESIAIIPVLRAGLGMTDALLDLMPYSNVHHIGMYRSKNNPLPVQYYNRLPKNEPCDVAYIVDASIGTSYTLNAVCSMIKKWGAKKIVIISVIASKEGLGRLMEQHPDISIYLAAVDDKLSEDGMIVPGIGDPGDRLFGKPYRQHNQDTQALLNGDDDNGEIEDGEGDAAAVVDENGKTKTKGVSSSSNSSSSSSSIAVTKKRKSSN